MEHLKSISASNGEEIKKYKTAEDSFGHGKYFNILQTGALANISADSI